MSSDPPSVALRYITRDGRPGMTWPCKLVEKRADLVALYIPRATPHKRWIRGEDGPSLVDVPWDANTLRLMFPGRAHSVWLNWDEGWNFTGYYVNLEEPFRRTAIGFDTNDHSLDILVTPDLTWSLKDEDILDLQRQRENFSHELVKEIRIEADRVIQTVERQEAPFKDGWERWSPDPRWSPPRLPENWNSLPAALWERRLWAYPHASDRSRSESG